MKKQLAIVGLLFMILLSSCTHYYYMPNIQNVPLLQEKNEFTATIARGVADETSTSEIQAVYTPTNYLAVMGNVMLASGGEKEENNWASGNYFEGGLGYFKPLDDFLVVELFAGYGFGDQHHVYGTEIKESGTSDLTCEKYFLQPAFGISYNSWEVALSIRFNKLYFTDINNQINAESHEPSYNMVEAISQRRTSYLYEPALTIRGGWKYFKVQFQYLNSVNRSHSDLDFEGGNISLGFYITLAKRYDSDIKSIISQK